MDLYGFFSLFKLPVYFAGEAVKSEVEKARIEKYTESRKFNPERQKYLEKLAFSVYQEDNDDFNEVYGRPLYRKGYDLSRTIHDAIVYIAHVEGWEYREIEDISGLARPSWHPGTEKEYRRERLVGRYLAEEEAIERQTEYQRWYDNCRFRTVAADVFPEEYRTEDEYHQAAYAKAKKVKICGVRARDYHSEEDFLRDVERAQGVYGEYNKPTKSDIHHMSMRYVVKQWKLCADCPTFAQRVAKVYARLHFAEASNPELLEELTSILNNMLVGSGHGDLFDLYIASVEERQDYFDRYTWFRKRPRQAVMIDYMDELWDREFSKNRNVSMAIVETVYGVGGFIGKEDAIVMLQEKLDHDLHRYSSCEYQDVRSMIKM